VQRGRRCAMRVDVCLWERVLVPLLRHTRRLTHVRVCRARSSLG
jgi:hypothetical protein